MTSTPRGHLGALRRAREHAAPHAGWHAAEIPGHEDLSTVTGKHAAFEQRRGSEGARSGAAGGAAAEPGARTGAAGAEDARDDVEAATSTSGCGWSCSARWLADRRASAIRKERSSRRRSCRRRGSGRARRWCSTCAAPPPTRRRQDAPPAPAGAGAANRGSAPLDFCQHAASRRAVARAGVRRPRRRRARPREAARRDGAGRRGRHSRCAVAQSSAHLSAQFSARDSPRNSALLFSLTRRAHPLSF